MLYGLRKLTEATPTHIAHSSYLTHASFVSFISLHVPALKNFCGYIKHVFIVELRMINACAFRLREKLIIINYAYLQVTMVNGCIIVIARTPLL